MKVEIKGKDMNFDVIDKRLNMEELFEIADEQGGVSGIIKISFDDIEDYSEDNTPVEIITDRFSSVNLKEFEYKIVAVDDDNNLYVRVSGYLSFDDIKAYEETKQFVKDWREEMEKREAEEKKKWLAKVRSFLALSTS